MTGFDFTGHMRQVCQDMAARVPALRHIDVDRVGVSFAQTRKAVRHGRFASLTPLRFEGGALHKIRRGRQYGLQRVYARDGSELLYILTFYLPRFLDLPLREKLDTIAHELWHISPKFDGDLRRHAGRCYAHGSSQKDFDAHAALLVEEWLAQAPPEPLWSFLKLTFRELSDHHGRIHGLRIRTPKLIRLD